MPGIHVNDLKSNTGAYARGYMFNAYFEDAPVGVSGGENLVAYLVRSTSLPESTITPVEVPWQGQTYKFGSTHDFSEGACTFNLDVGATLRSQMEEGVRKIHDPATNLQGTPADYFAVVKLELLNPTDASVVMTYVLHQAWPSSVGALELSHDNKDVAQMDCTFNYNGHTIE